MEKLQMCRLCLVKNVRMFEVVDENFHQLYEKLTDIPFVTEDSRPTLACFICYAKLKQCCRFKRKCLEAEELFTQILNEPNLLTNRHQIQLFSGLITSPIENISTVNVAEKGFFIKEELPAVCEGLENIKEPNKELQSDDQELENVDNGSSDVEEIKASHSESDSDDLPLMEFKVEEEEQVPRKKRRASHTKRVPVVILKKHELDARKEKPEDIIAKEGRANVMKRVPVVILQKLQLDTRRIKPEDIITEEQKKNEQSYPKVVSTTQNRSFKPTCKESSTLIQPRVNNSISNTTLETNCPNNSNKNDIKYEISNKNVVSDNINRLCVKEKPFKCGICQHRFTRKNDLKYHISRLHVETGKSYICDICQRCFGHKDKLKRHIRLHTCVNPYMCAICERCFPFKSILRIHIRTHTGEKLFKCDICQSKFSTKYTLERHMNTHTGVKPYECEICQRAFSTKFVLKEHVRTHTDEKLYHCAICERGFNQRYNLSAHIRMHTGVKPYKCEICPYRCSDKRNLKKHVNNKHADGKP